MSDIPLPEQNTEQKNEEAVESTTAVAQAKGGIINIPTPSSKAEAPVAATAEPVVNASIEPVKPENPLATITPSGETTATPTKGGIGNWPIVPKHEPSIDVARVATVSPEVPVQAPKKAPTSPEEITTAQRALLADYQADVANAMSQTDASAIQHFIQDAKDKEATDNERAKRNRERTFLATMGTLFFLVALGAFAYSGFHFHSLTVPLEHNVSLGAFPVSTSRIVAADTKESEIVQIVSKDPSLAIGTPMLVDIVDKDTGALLAPSELFTYLDIKGTEPFETSFSVLRYGFAKLSDTQVVPFVIGAVQDEVVGSKEFLIAEPTLTALFSTALGIDPKDLIDVAGGGFVQETKYNIPVRILRAQKSDPRKTTFVYGFVQDKTAVFTTDERVLQLVENTIINQH